MADITFQELQQRARAARSEGGAGDSDASFEEIQERAEGDTASSLAADFGTQFLAGIDDVTGALARPLESTFGTIRLGGPQGTAALSPEEASQARERGELGVPGAAEEQADSLFGSAGRLGGQSAAAGPVLGRAAGLVSAPSGAASGIVGRTAQAGRRFVHGAGQTFSRAPVAGTAVEGGFGATAGAGGHVASELYPDSQAAQFVGEILGGVAPVFMPARLAFRGGRRVAQVIRRPFTETGGRRRGRARAARASPGEARRRAVSELETPTTLDPDTGQPVLTPAQRTGDPGMLALERAVVESSEQLKRESDEQIASANQAIQASMRGVSDGEPGAAAATIEEAQSYLSGLMDTRVRIAAQRADERIAELGPNSTPEQANQVAADELRKVIDNGRQQERSLYDAIPQDAPAPTSNAQDRLQAWRNELGKARQGDIPPEARRFLARKQGDKNNPNFLGDETTIREIRDLQSKLRETARNARAGDKKNLTRAKIADEIANSLNDDIANARVGPEASEAVEIATGFSRRLNERINQGTVGRLTGRRVTGEAAVPDNLTLEQSLGMGGPRAAQALDDLKAAFDSPEAPDSSLMVGAAEDYVRSQFMRAATAQGKLKPQRAQQFLDRNREVLDRLPSLRDDIQQAMEAGDMQALRERQRSRVRFDDPRRSKAAMFVQKGPTEAFNQISQMTPAQAARETQRLLNRARRDGTGEAVEGLKSGFLEFLYSGARENARDIAGERFMSGFALRDTMRDPRVRQAMNRLFTESERDRLQTIQNDLMRLERRRQAELTSEGVIGDRPTKVVETVAGITGAASGRHTSAQLGTGANVQIPGIMANRFRDLVEAGVQDPATQLMRDAVHDETLFRDLLQESLEDGELGETAQRRLNAWAAAVAAEHGGTLDDGEEERPAGGER